MNALKNYLTDKENGVSVESVESPSVARMVVDEIVERESAMRRHHEQQALRTLEKSLALPEGMLEITAEDRLRAAIVEALTYLDQNSPPAAHAALMRALQI